MYERIHIFQITSTLECSYAYLFMDEIVLCNSKNYFQPYLEYYRILPWYVICLTTNFVIDDPLPFSMTFSTNPFSITTITTGMAQEVLCSEGMSWRIWVVHVFESTGSKDASGFLFDDLDQGDCSSGNDFRISSILSCPRRCCLGKISSSSCSWRWIDSYVSFSVMLLFMWLPIYNNEGDFERKQY